MRLSQQIFRRRFADSSAVAWLRTSAQPELQPRTRSAPHRLFRAMHDSPVLALGWRASAAAACALDAAASEAFVHAASLRNFSASRRADCNSASGTVGA